MRDERGRLLPGHKINKYDFDKDRAKKLLSDQLYHIVKLISRPRKELQEAYDEGVFDDESFLVNICMTDFKKSESFRKWLFEMLIGKPKQQIEQTNKNMPVTHEELLEELEKMKEDK